MGQHHRDTTTCEIVDARHEVRARCTGTPNIYSSGMISRRIAYFTSDGRVLTSNLRIRCKRYLSPCGEKPGCRCDQNIPLSVCDELNDLSLGGREEARAVVGAPRDRLRLEDVSGNCLSDVVPAVGGHSHCLNQFFGRRNNLFSASDAPRRSVY